MIDADYWIAKLNLKPHPEGGYYKEIFRSGLEIKKKGSELTRKACTSIYFLLREEEYSAFHRLGSDEIWYFHQGQPIRIYEIDTKGNLKTHELSDQETGRLSVVIEAGCWFAASVHLQTGYSLVSCAVAPAFEFSEFEMAKKNELKSLFPEHHRIIEKYCR